MSVTFVDFVGGLAFIAICVLSLTQGVMRQLISLGVLYFCTAVVGFLYPVAAHFTQALGGEAFSSIRETVVFLILMVSATIGLEALTRKWFPDTRFPRLGVFDIILAIGPGIICGLIVASLLVATLGFLASEPWGGNRVPIQNAVSAWVRDAQIRPILSQFTHFYMLTQRFWFRRLPPIYSYLLPDGP
jgi:hypothetical protein